MTEANGTENGGGGRGGSTCICDIGTSLAVSATESDPFKYTLPHPSWGSAPFEGKPTAPRQLCAQLPSLAFNSSLTHHAAGAGHHRMLGKVPAAPTRKISHFISFECPPPPCCPTIQLSKRNPCR
ncbi:hypothetical protein BDK51DRAFT_51167 [Blyttiomyces helicus]|uniref:Uncharacterized protein n=1 Tax=Blyttiomyces helicus TaxID=388810 RepID=A0A4V1IPQ0_9FUNG|nr:hypothetical protein BDK51DRAFT_51167 [Blyttiomyces helicus]|eukprot:RKO83827.1 hypothetical protein BDK51DRAFT_51167 [Blyttiomyces helicus]